MFSSFYNVYSEFSQRYNFCVLYKSIIFVKCSDTIKISCFRTLDKTIYMRPSELTVKIINSGPHPLPDYSTVGSAGMDIRAWLPAGPVILAPMERRLIPTGLRMEIPCGYEAQIRPRSGLALRQGLTVLNTPGTIDSDYRGDIGVIMINLGGTPVTISDGDRICQMVVAPVAKVTWHAAGGPEENSLSHTDRGEGGFGHSGV